MATTENYLNFILERLENLPEVTHIKMMGEYILYYRGRIAAYICDNNLLVKSVPSAVALLPEAVSMPPYPGAKPMLRVDYVDNSDKLCTLFKAMYDELPEPKPKKPKKAKKTSNSL